jgi:hypothetical protein
VVCLIFIFLTPKSWLSVGERPQPKEHQSPIATKVVLSPEVVANEADRGQIEQQIRTLTGRSKVEVLAVRKVVDVSGRTVSFEVDIR